MIPTMRTSLFCVIPLFISAATSTTLSFEEHVQGGDVSGEITHASSQDFGAPALFCKRDDVLYDPSRKADYMLERLFLDVMHDVDFAKNEIAVEAFLKSVVGISDRFAEASALADKVGGSQAKVLEDKRSLVGNVLNMMYEVSVALPQWKGKDGSDKCLRELYQVRPMAYTFVNTEGVPQKDREGFDEFAKQKLAQLEDTKYRLRGYNLKPGEEKKHLAEAARASVLLYNMIIKSREG